jgi:hypothetical protein
LKITESNFAEYFFDVRKQPKPRKGQVMACWRAKADFVNGWVKKNVLELLATNATGAVSAHKVLRNMVGALEKDSILVAKEMTQDLLNGLSEDEILEKPYRFTIEQFYWTEPQYIPKDDPHWSTINMVDLTEQENSAYIPCHE